jgi:hypothetical protein
MSELQAHSLSISLDGYEGWHWVEFAPSKSVTSVRLRGR